MRILQNLLDSLIDIYLPFDIILWIYCYILMYNLHYVLKIFIHKEIKLKLLEFLELFSRYISNTLNTLVPWYFVKIDAKFVNRNEVAKARLITETIRSSFSKLTQPLWMDHHYRKSTSIALSSLGNKQYALLSQRQSRD